GFLASTCMEWESAVLEGASRFGARVVRFRSGVVLARKGGMYAQLRPLAAKGLGVIMGSGKQYLPWIHLIDAARAYTYALENSQMNGVYNLASPDVITFGQFMRELATRLDQKIFLPPVPAFLVKLGLGE